MFSRVTFPTFVLSIASLVLADPAPSSPGPGDVFKPGSACPIAWTPDSTGTWKTMNIELMTGDNLNMVHLTTVGSVDGTTSPGTYSYTCPAVTIPSAIYFYQFTSPSSSDKLWTGRFTITDSSGATVSPPNTTQPDGEAIPWGTGALTDPSKAVAAPVIGTNSTSSNTTSTASVSGSAASSVTASSASSSGSAAGSTNGASPAFASSSGAASDTSSGPAAAASSTPGSNSGGALALGAVSSRAAKAGVALAVIAGTFIFIA
ncbi:hypothetical protein BJV74DRAFT_850335 [Russula compacta]|nr:hypothetical protein BJV74DRAFT_782753 [Russula compacta]KAH9983497.1 hypothetical protein BJV74DRAFT_850335 [Russula compacta]